MGTWSQMAVTLQSCMSYDSALWLNTAILIYYYPFKSQTMPERRG